MEAIRKDIKLEKEITKKNLLFSHWEVGRASLLPYFDQVLPLRLELKTLCCRREVRSQISSRFSAAYNASFFEGC